VEFSAENAAGFFSVLTVFLKKSIRKVVGKEGDGCEREATWRICILTAIPYSNPKEYKFSGARATPITVLTPHFFEQALYFTIPMRFIGKSIDTAVHGIVRCKH
jgi:hypothetical protein